MSNEIWVVALGGGFTAAVVSGLIQIVMWKLNRKAALDDKAKCKDDYVKTALKILMQDRIKYLGKKYISDGAIDAEDLRDLMEMHKCYHDDLSGNGFLDNVMHQVKRLPIHK